MNIIKKISDTEYQVGKYRVIERSEDKWTIVEDSKYIADFYDRHTALSWANLMYTCGTMVSQGTRELLLIAAKELGI
jgi:hypothetical protein